MKTANCVRAARVLLLCVLLMPSMVDQRASAQNEAYNMATIISGLQTGQMNWNRFYPPLKQVIAMQTNSTGVYLGLRQLGPVRNVVLLGGWRLPNGFYYYFRSFFDSGAVDWEVASDQAGNIAGLSFYPASSNSVPNTGATPDGKKQPDPTPAPVDTGGSEPKGAQTKDEACQKYPGLC